MSHWEKGRRYARALKPLSRREMGWGEGTSRVAPEYSNCARLRPYPHPPLRGTFSPMKEDNVPVGEGQSVR
ncbi:hypothetical protein FHR61_000036 [Xanthomonas arboricola]|uniref:Uncharacterized protein n=1 Tax=Xanthomonas cannabis TaxID=1885674 RepID=A0ABR6JR64_9XANT|nr:hypothetical protein [Xanthomonas cannabis]MBB5520240.1 hypothetical protein [Xanthomonas cannabis]